MEPLFDNLYYIIANNNYMLFRRHPDGFDYCGHISAVTMLDHPEIAVDMVLHAHDVMQKVAS